MLNFFRHMLSNDKALITSGIVNAAFIITAINVEDRFSRVLALFACLILTHLVNIISYGLFKDGRLFPKIRSIAKAKKFAKTTESKRYFILIFISAIFFWVLAFNTMFDKNNAADQFPLYLFLIPVIINRLFLAYYNIPLITFYTSSSKGNQNSYPYHIMHKNVYADPMYSYLSTNIFYNDSHDRRIRSR